VIAAALAQAGRHDLLDRERGAERRAAGSRWEADSAARGRRRRDRQAGCPARIAARAAHGSRRRIAARCNPRNRTAARRATPVGSAACRPDSIHPGGCSRARRRRPSIVVWTSSLDPTARSGSRSSDVIPRTWAPGRRSPTSRTASFPPKPARSPPPENLFPGSPPFWTHRPEHQPGSIAEAGTNVRRRSPTPHLVVLSRRTLAA
jgi:hypothetical protein